MISWFQAETLSHRVTHTALEPALGTCRDHPSYRPVQGTGQGCALDASASRESAAAGRLEVEGMGSYMRIITGPFAYLPLAEQESNSPGCRAGAFVVLGVIISQGYEQIKISSSQEEFPVPVPGCLQVHPHRSTAQSWREELAGRGKGCVGCSASAACSRAPALPPRAGHSRGPPGGIPSTWDVPAPAAEPEPQSTRLWPEELPAPLLQEQPGRGSPEPSKKCNNSEQSKNSPPCTGHC